MSTTSAKNFGEYLGRIRRGKRITLRDFCLNNGFDSVETSKIERNVLPPPSEKAVDRLVDALGLSPADPEYQVLRDLAEAGRSGAIPTTAFSGEEFESNAPLVFRTERGEKLPKSLLKDLFDHLREA